MLERANLLGAVVAIGYYALTILLFVLRLLGRAQLGHLLASLQFLAAPVLIYLLIVGPSLGRPWLTYVQIALMLFFLVVELLLDYVLKIEFRQIRWAVITYVTLFFAATGGMLGLAADAGRPWALIAEILFLVMAILAFVQRAVTGM